MPNTGLFGIKGTARDLLGGLGDAFLLQAGRDRVYAPMREKEKLGEAFAGFTENPLQAINAIGQQNPELGGKLLNEYYQREHDKNTLAENTRVHDATRRESALKILPQLGGMLNTIRSSDNPAAAYATIQPLLTRMAQFSGLDPSMVPSTYNPEAVNALAAYDWGTGQQMTHGEEVRHHKEGEAVDRGQLGVAQGTLGVAQGKLDLDKKEFGHTVSKDAAKFLIEKEAHDSTMKNGGYSDIKGSSGILPVAPVNTSQGKSTTTTKAPVTTDTIPVPSKVGLKFTDNKTGLKYVATPGKDGKLIWVPQK